MNQATFCSLCALALESFSNIQHWRRILPRIRTARCRWWCRTRRAPAPTFSRASSGRASPSAGKRVSSPTTAPARPATSAPSSCRKRRPTATPCSSPRLRSAPIRRWTRRLPFDPVKSFAPVVLVATSALALVVHPQLPVKSMREFVELARKRQPGKLDYSSPGNGGPQHLAMELLKIETRHRRGARAVQRCGRCAHRLVMGGHVQAMVSALQTAAPFVHGGQAAHAGVMSAARRRRFPKCRR